MSTTISIFTSELTTPSRYGFSSIPEQATSLTRGTLKTLGLKLAPAGQTIGVGEGLADVFRTDNVSFSLPGITIGRQKFAVLSFDNVEECLKKLDVDVQGQITPRAVAATEGQPIDGLLGSEFFRLFVVGIDYAKKTIDLHDPDDFRYQGDGEKIPLEVTQSHIFIRTSISASPDSPVTAAL